MEVNKSSRPDKGRRTALRRSDNRDNSEGRRSSSRRETTVRRMLVSFFHSLHMPRVADVVKTTKLIEPLFTAVTLVLSGITNTKTMGFSAGAGLVIALCFHEWGHFHTARKAGYQPYWWWFIPLLGAVMRFPEIKSRSDESRIAFGGPLYGFLFTIAVSILWFLSILYPQAHTWKVLSEFLFTIAFVSIILNLFNLIPISPLDGGRICQGMDGNWPKVMRFIGFVLLIVVTALSRQATMLVIWILVIGELRLSFRGHVLGKSQRFTVGLCIFLAMLTKLYFEYTTGALYGWELLGEFAYSMLAFYILKGYYQEWKYPERFQPARELRLRPVGKKAGQVIRLHYFVLVPSFIALLLILLESYGRFH